MVELVPEEGEVECSTWTQLYLLLEALDNKNTLDLIWGCCARFHEWWDPLVVLGLGTGLAMECWIFWIMELIKGGIGIDREGGEQWGEVSRSYDAWKYDPCYESIHFILSYAFFLNFLLQTYLFPSYNYPYWACEGDWPCVCPLLPYMIYGDSLDLLLSVISHNLIQLCQ